MRPLRLYIDNFMCYDKAFIDFTQFSSALVVGKAETNELESNGVGKTTIFKAIEYVLFNHFDNPLERVIRDDADSCKIVFDFLINDQEYRLSRIRTKKGSTDLILLERNAQSGLEEEAYHLHTDAPFIEKKDTKKYWKDKTGSRTGDTEKDLIKLIKINHKAFKSTFFFPQNDIGGLPTATPEKRKVILKEAFNLAIYTKLEKMAKERSSNLLKDIEKNKLIIETLGDPKIDLLSLSSELQIVVDLIIVKNSEYFTLNEELESKKKNIQDSSSVHINMEEKFYNLLVKEKSLLAEKSKLEILVKEYISKKYNIIKSAEEIIKEIKSLKNNQIKLAEIDYSQIDILLENLSNKKEDVTRLNFLIKNKMELIDELKIPLPNGSVCKNCRKPMSDKDREEHKNHINQEMINCQNIIQDSKKELNKLNLEITFDLSIINSLSLSKQQLEGINTKITVKNKEIQDKNSAHDEYAESLTRFSNDLKEKNKEIEVISKELKSSSIEEANLLKIKIEEEQISLNNLLNRSSILTKEIAHFNNNKAVITHNIEQKSKDNSKIDSLRKVLKELEDKFSVFPSVLQAFSSTGIPNLIIQNVLDDLQIEANNLLSQLRPGLQLSFFVEKTVSKTGDAADTLDINYHINGKPRYYEQLSGAMQLSVMFSLKLGLAFLLQKMFGTDIKLLLLDELDQSLDPVRVDTYAEIVKFFQKDFTILVITHNDRLKDKFSHAILVEQDINMISRAKVVTSW